MNASTKTRKHILAIACAVAMVAALALAGCGSYGSSSSGGSRSGSSSSSSSPAPQAQTLPSNGHIFSGSSTGDAGIEITAASSESCWAKVYTSSGKLQISFFIRAGKTVYVDVPAGTYTIHFATGKTWYGTGDKFGSGTSYGQDKSVRIDSGYYMTYTLQASSGGNWSPSSLDASNF